MKPWWERFPERLEHELRMLESAGYSFERDEEAFRAGYGALRLTASVKGWGKIPLIIRFPYFYPYFQFQAFAHQLSLRLHQNPFGKNLCLIGRDPERWYPESTVAEVLNEMLPKVLAADQTDDSDRARDLEQDQAEPFSEYYTYLPGSAVLWDGEWSLSPEIPGGSLKIGFHPNRHNENPLKIPANAAILSLSDSKGKVLIEADPRIRQLYSGEPLDGKWVRLEEPIQEADQERFYSKLLEGRSVLKEFVESCKRKNAPAVIGAVFPEEIARRRSSDGWVFLHLKPQKGKKSRIRMIPFLMRPQRAGLQDMGSRLPFYSLLNRKTVALAGLGCLGAPSALEFARNGVGQLRLLDCDNVDVGTTVRWPFGLAEAGNNKIATIWRFIYFNYPYTQVLPFNIRLGEAYDQAPVKSDLDVMAEFLEGADLLFDASADLNVNHLLSDLARERRIPYVAISTTYGAWGGQIVRIRPGETRGCWFCYRHSLLHGVIPYANSDPRGNVQPGGCGTPTYTGAGFDAQEIALGGVRTAISTLTSGEENGYPVMKWDAAVVNLRNTEGDAIPPHWQIFPIENHPSCHCQSEQ